MRGTEKVLHSLERLGWSGLARRDEPMARHTSFKVGGPAELFVEPETADQAVELARICAGARVRLRVLGGGTNLLVCDAGVASVVLCTKRLRAESCDGRRLGFAAGVPLARALKKAADSRLGGLETLAGIPGTIGGALVMNAGGKYGAIGELVKTVTILDGKHGIREIPGVAARFAYRSSGIENSLVLGCVLECIRRDKNSILRRASDILREKKASQPLWARSAGCFFKNPPSGPSAGKLIDDAGLKGIRLGGASVSRRHANFIVAGPGSTAADVRALADSVAAEVEARFGVILEPEVRMWGRE
ncbi:MAG: UDP-N-acetylmuramate dehydrogenase [Planctomycetota bacterium]|nr:UDP-N-acetylmuramate dehydrogenase [Planctomycetota bacterium]